MGAVASRTGGRPFFRAGHHALAVFAGLVLLARGGVTAAANGGLLGRSRHLVRRLVPGGVAMRLARPVAGVAFDATGKVRMLLEVSGRLTVTGSANLMQGLRAQPTGGGGEKEQQQGRNLQPILRIILRFNSPRLRTPVSAMASFSSMLSNVKTRSTPG